MNINYQELINDAMLGVVKKLLQKIASDTERSDHHFYINFVTSDPWVILPPKVKEKYPEKMCIVLQYEFYDLRIYEDRFSVLLSFDGIQEKVTVPFRAIIDFTDPFAKFRLEFPHSAQPKNSDVDTEDDHQHLDDYQKYMHKQKQFSQNLIKAQKPASPQSTSKLNKMKNLKIEKSDNIISLDFKNKQQ